MKEASIKAKAVLLVTGDRYEPDGIALVEIEKKGDGYYFSWKAVDSAETDIAEDHKLLAFSSMDNAQKPHAYLEQYITTNIQKTVLKRKNRMKVSEWTWIER